MRVLWTDVSSIWAQHKRKHQTFTHSRAPQLIVRRELEPLLDALSRSLPAHAQESQGACNYLVTQ